MLGVYTKIHVVYESDQLSERDCRHFVSYQGYLDYDNVLEYPTGIDFEVKDAELDIFD